MALTLSQHIAVLKDCYNVSEMSSIWIDGNEISGYFTYTFVKSKTLNKKVKRSIGGQIKNINNYTFFLTPRVKIFFNYLSLSSYQTIMRLIQSKNEFTVRLFDIEQGKMVEHRMYFSTEDYPELAFGYGKLRGIKGYTIELQGTNNEPAKPVVIRYHLNPPAVTGYVDSVVDTDVFSNNSDIIVGKGATNSLYGNFQDYTFDNRYKFSKWGINANGTGFKYLNGEEYTINNEADWVLENGVYVFNLYAQWQQGG